MQSEYFLTGYVDEAPESEDIEEEIPESEDQRDPFEGLIEPDLEHVRRRPGRAIQPAEKPKGDAA